MTKLLKHGIAVLAAAGLMICSVASATPIEFTGDGIIDVSGPITLPASDLSTLAPGPAATAVRGPGVISSGLSGNGYAIAATGDCRPEFAKRRSGGLNAWGMVDRSARFDNCEPETPEVKVPEPQSVVLLVLGLGLLSLAVSRRLLG